MQQRGKLNVGNEKESQTQKAVTPGREWERNESKVRGFAESGTGDAGGGQKADGYAECGI